MIVTLAGAPGRPPAPPSSPVGTIRLLWIPLGAGGHVVRHTGAWYERWVAHRERRPARDLYHAALQIETPSGGYAVEVAPAWGPGSGRAGVVATGSVGCRAWGRWRAFRYEVRCARGGVLPDLDYAVGGDTVWSNQDAERLLGLVPVAPTPTWGRDELGLGEMWNSNSLVAWLLAASGHDLHGVVPPGCGRAPGWDAGVAYAARQAADPHRRPARLRRSAGGRTGRSRV